MQSNEIFRLLILVLLIDNEKNKCTESNSSTTNLNTIILITFLLNCRDNHNYNAPNQTTPPLDNLDDNFI